MYIVIYKSLSRKKEMVESSCNRWREVETLAMLTTISVAQYFPAAYQKRAWGILPILHIRYVIYYWY